MEFKKGVMIVENYQYFFMRDAVNLAYKTVLGIEPIMTSGCESVTDQGPVNHAKNSLHWQHLAWDFRIKNSSGSLYSDDIINQLAGEMIINLGKLFDVVIEKDHIHVEYDPK